MEAGASAFKELYADLSVENVLARAPRVYAPDALFNDTLKTLQGSPAITDYLQETARRAHAVHVLVEDTAFAGVNCYLRWYMDIKWKKFKEGQVTRSQGVSLLRFDPDGRVLLHQDYWDSTTGFFIHIPLIGWALRKIIERV